MDRKILGQRIRQAREQKGLSQEQFAYAIARDQRSVSEYENGKRSIYAHEIPTIAQALEVSVASLYEDTLNLNDLDYGLLEQFHRLNKPEARKTLLNLIKTLVDYIEAKG